MKNALIGLGVLLFGLLVLLGMTFRGATLPVSEDVPIVLANPPRVAGVRLSALYAGRMESIAAFAYRGGAYSDTRVFGMGAILVRHPQGNLLFDTGFGKDVDAHVASMPLLLRATTSYAKEQTVAEQLAAAKVPLEEISRVVLTHAHWDHVSGIPDLEGVQIMVSQEEAAFIESDDPMAALVHSFKDLAIAPLNYREGPYLGFPSSFDVFADGSVVMVPAPGHTPGSTITFVHTEDGRHYALVGDLVWQKEGIDLPAERPWLPRMMVDHDPEAVRGQIVHMHRLQQMWPELVIVPAHDRRVWDTLPRFPQGFAEPAPAPAAPPASAESDQASTQKSPYTAVMG
jgi:glyoxylase-like metal-dependent hydrolase (beta-lactamase superfamily II)